jgi:hypothetical protein
VGVDRGHPLQGEGPASPGVGGPRGVEPHQVRRPVTAPQVEDEEEELRQPLMKRQRLTLESDVESPPASPAADQDEGPLIIGAHQEQGCRPYQVGGPLGIALCLTRETQKACSKVLCCMRSSWCVYLPQMRVHVAHRSHRIKGAVVVVCDVWKQGCA